MFGLEAYKPLLTALALPPVPLLLLTLVGARLILPRRGLGWLLVLLSVLGLWFSACEVSARWLQRHVLHAPRALGSDEIERLRGGPGSAAAGGGTSAAASPAAAHSRRKPAPASRAASNTAILVLGAGGVPLAPEYGVSDLTPASAERLRYGVWLSRQTGLPLGFAGGVGWAQKGTGMPAEAEIATRVAQQFYGMPLRWAESDSADTRGNAALAVKMLHAAGVQHIVLVTHAMHMPRALRHFERAVAETAGPGAIKVTPAPMGGLMPGGRPELDWLPSGTGARQVRDALHEALGLALGA